MSFFWKRGNLRKYRIFWNIINVKVIKSLKDNPLHKHHSYISSDFSSFEGINFKVKIFMVNVSCICKPLIFYDIIKTLILSFCFPAATHNIYKVQHITKLIVSLATEASVVDYRSVLIKCVRVLWFV